MIERVVRKSETKDDEYNKWNKIHKIRVSIKKFKKKLLRKFRMKQTLKLREEIKEENKK
jgi:hypothetical protein